MDIIKIISEHKRKFVNKPVKQGYKRVMAIVEESGLLQTRHLDISK